MPTVIFYCSILLLSTLFVYLSEKGRSKLDYYFFLTIAFLLVFIPSAIRYGIGTDFVNYTNIYLNIEYYSWMELGFYYICLFLNYLDANVQWMFVVFAFIFTIVAFKAYPKEHAWLFHFAFIAILWFASFNIVRQAIALSFCILAIMRFIDGKYINFFILCGLGYLFHRSSLFMLLTGLIAYIPLNQSLKTKLMPNILLGGIVFTYLSVSIVLPYLEQFVNLLGMEKYAGYFSSSKHFVERDFGSGLGVLIKIIFLLYVIYKSNLLIAINKNYWFVIILCFLYAMAVILASNIIIFGRIADLFSIAMVLSLFLLYKHDWRNIVTKFVVISFSIYLMLTFVKLGFGEETSYADPKRNPYVTIFSDKM